jgi:hypothetical protein
MRLDASALRALNLMDSGNVSRASRNGACVTNHSSKGLRSKEHDAPWTLEQMQDRTRDADARKLAETATCQSP